MTPEEADRHVGTAAAYVHIPFCSSVCPYCDFAVVAGRDDLAGRYVDAVCAEISGSDEWRPLEAVYFGGGTPSHIDPSLLSRILDALTARHGVSSDAEITLEANPEDFSADQASALRNAGFNRVSFGAQSFDSRVLVSLGRRHQATHIDSSVSVARTAGFDNVSVDLIYGTPGETGTSWTETLQRAVSLEPDHVSCYALTVEPGTPLGRSVRAGAEAPDPDVQADRFGAADALLTDSGFERYEVSNWTRAGKECRYNMTVWAQGEYEAYGNGAHGFREGVRFRNHRRLDAYLEKIESTGSARVGEDVLWEWDAEIDRLFVGLRRTVGVASGPGTDALLDSEDGKMLIEAGVVAEENGRLVVTRPLLTDAVHRSVLAQNAPIVIGDGDA
ncbi:MAG TPA: radical SAM family heme chaperone HemW [Acidimicrobiia bacterium]|nr:radical SAM family heme chaperone HemW [Acidimicrobiia bacterium]